MKYKTGKYILHTTGMRKIEVDKDGKFVLTDDKIELVDRVTKFGHGAKVGCLKKYLRKITVQCTITNST